MTKNVTVHTIYLIPNSTRRVIHLQASCLHGLAVCIVIQKIFECKSELTMVGICEHVLLHQRCKCFHMNCIDSINLSVRAEDSLEYIPSISGYHTLIGLIRIYYPHEQPLVSCIHSSLIKCLKFVTQYFTTDCKLK